MKHIPRKRFGQNFLKDPTVLDAIIEAIAPKPEDIMVEIGPGMGAMTERLLSCLKRMDAVELDRDLVSFLQKKFKGSPLTIHQGDALAFDFQSLQPSTGQKIRIVGNLPYNISTPLLFHLMSFADHVRDQHFMLQKEVVERMAAGHGSKTYGRLSIMLQWRYDIDMLFTVPPTAFSPAPKVDSAIVRMIPKHRLSPAIWKTCPKWLPWRSPNAGKSSVTTLHHYFQRKNWNWLVLTQQSGRSN